VGCAQVEPLEDCLYNQTHGAEVATNDYQCMSAKRTLRSMEARFMHTHQLDASKAINKQGDMNVPN
jgi:hypothetical protein